jgi:protoporphyrinogen oxidase
MASIQPAVYAARSFVATEPRCQSRRRARKEILDQISDLGLVDRINESPQETDIISSGRIWPIAAFS